MSEQDYFYGIKGLIHGVITPQDVENASWGLLGQSAEALHAQVGHRDVYSEIVRNNYKVALRTVLTTLQWDFPIEQKKLVFVDDERGGALRPSDCLQILAIGCCTDCCGVLHNTGWDERNGRLYPCCCGDQIRYIGLNERFENWAPTALEMLITHLAELSAPQVLQDRSGIVLARLHNHFMKLKQEAIGIKGKMRRFVR